MAGVRSKLRQTRAWGLFCACATVLLVAVWGASLWRRFELSAGHTHLGVVAGRIVIEHSPLLGDVNDINRLRPLWSPNGGRLMKPEWRPERTRQWGGWQVYVPLWPLVLVVGVCIIDYARPYARLKRVLKGKCGNCGYSRVGLRPGVVCPECGTPIETDDGSDGDGSG